MKSKKTIAALLSAVLCVALLAGCTPAKPNPPTNTPSDPTTQTPNEKLRTDIVLGVGGDAVSLDPHNAADTSSGAVIMAIYDTLIKTDKDGNLMPGIAETWEQTSPTSYVFNLRKNVKFHNGDALTSKDIVYSLTRQMNSPKVKTLMENVSEVKAIDEYTVEVTTSVPHAPFLMNLTSYSSAIVSEKAVTEAESKGGTYGLKPVGTGRMVFQEWRQNDKIVVSRFEDYFLPLGRTTSITWRVIPEQTSLTIALENSEIDFLGLVQAVDVSRVKANDKLRYVEAPNAGLSYVGFNMLVKPLDDVRVRQALCYAMNREDILDVILEGYGNIATSIFTSVSPVFNDKINPYPYDLEKAKELLAAAGYADGFQIKIATNNEERNRIAQLLQAEYAKIGVTLEIEVLEWGAFLESISGKTHEMFISGAASTMNPDAMMSPMFHSKSPAASGNRSWYANPEMDRLIEEARMESDADKRKELYFTMQEMIIDEAVISPLTQKINLIAMAKGVEGVVLYRTDMHDYTDMVVKE